MYSTADNRPKQPILKGKDNWSTWSNGFSIYLRGKGTYDVIAKPPPLNPSPLEDTTALVKEYILDNEEIEEEKVTTQKVASNKRKVTKVLQKEYDEWDQRNNQTVSDIYYACSTSIQSLIGKYRSAKELWNFFIADAVCCCVDKSLRLTDISSVKAWATQSSRVISAVSRCRISLVRDPNGVPRPLSIM
jgi:hypothetical protein